MFKGDGPLVLDYMRIYYGLQPILEQCKADKGVVVEGQIWDTVLQDGLDKPYNLLGKLCYTEAGLPRD